MRYSPERKEAVLRKMMPPHNRTIRELAKEERISEATLYNWRQQARDKGVLMPDADAGPEGWAAREKFAAVLESAAFNDAELAEYGKTLSSLPKDALKKQESIVLREIRNRFGLIGILPFFLRLFLEQRGLKRKYSEAYQASLKTARV